MTFVESENICSKDKIDEKPNNRCSVSWNVNVSLIYSNSWYRIIDEGRRCVEIVICSKVSNSWENDISPKDEMIFKAH